MFNIEPQRTQFDVHFSVGGFPVRVHPLFWVGTLLLGIGSLSKPNPPAEVLIWIVVVFFSILMHELGHALAFRYYGSGARIVLWMLGGLAIPEDRQSAWDSYQERATRAMREQVVISFAGPMAGFVLAAVVLLIVRLAGSRVGVGELTEPGSYYYPLSNRIPFWFQAFDQHRVNVVVRQLLHVNILWGLVNLLPVFPLDGGQISRALFLASRPFEGERQAFMLSMGTAILVAVGGLVMGELFVTIMFGLLAFTSWQALQQLGGRERW